MPGHDGSEQSALVQNPSTILSSARIWASSPTHSVSLAKSAMREASRVEPLYRAREIFSCDVSFGAVELTGRNDDALTLRVAVWLSFHSASIRALAVISDVSHKATACAHPFETHRSVHRASYRQALTFAATETSGAWMCVSLYIVSVPATLIVRLHRQCSYGASPCILIGNSKDPSPRSSRLPLKQRVLCAVPQGMADRRVLTTHVPVELSAAAPCQIRRPRALPELQGGLACKMQSYKG